MSIRDLVVPALRDYEYYKAAGQDYRIILNANEHYDNFLNGKLKKEFTEKMNSLNLNRYPDPSATVLRQKFADMISVEPECVMATSGSDEGITIISSTFIDRDDVVVSCEPTFSMYSQACLLAKGRYVPVEGTGEKMTPDVELLIKTANENDAKIVYICTPNNPTGYLYSADEIKRVVDETKGLVVVDEAYIHFAESDNLELLDYSNRVVILRTLSKAFAGAGLRVGFIVADRSVINYLNAAKAPYNLSMTSQAAGEVLIDNYELIKSEVEVIKKERDRIVRVLEDAEGVVMLPVNANFITIRTDKAKQLYDECEERGISIRSYGDSIKNTVRISVGSREQNDELLEVIREVFI